MRGINSLKSEDTGGKSPGVIRPFFFTEVQHTHVHRQWVKDRVVLFVHLETVLKRLGGDNYSVAGGQYGRLDNVA